MIYELTCADCAFKTVVMGTHEDVLDTIERHQAAHQDGGIDHFVEFRGVLTNAFTGDVVNREEVLLGEVVRSPNAFKEVLTMLLRIARSNGVDVEGSWVCSAGDDLPEWEAQISEKERGE